MAKNQPKTGDGNTGGRKPKAGDCAQRQASGNMMRKQPSEGWAATFIAARRKRGL
jgi:hypothetical protein